MSFLEITPGEAPLVLSFPHTGTEIPDEIVPALSSLTLARQDTDWFVHELYAFAKVLGATMLRTTISRSVIDLNRDPTGASLYPGMATTDLCPTTTFFGNPIYLTSCIPNAIEIARRRQVYFDPYHNALPTVIAQMRNRHSRIVLFDCHSIRSRIPRLFPGELPELNIGTFDGRSCDPCLSEKIVGICADSGKDTALNGRFKGGWIIRRYGEPTAGVHAVQMELAQRLYMDEPPLDQLPTKLDAARCSLVRQILRQVLEACLAFAREE